MKKTIDGKKLKLNIEHIRQLTLDDLKKAVGGDPGSLQCPTRGSLCPGCG